MARENSTTLYAPDGTEYRSASPVETTRLKARGYTTRKPSRRAPAKSAGDDTSSAKSAGDK